MSRAFALAWWVCRTLDYPLEDLRAVLAAAEERAGEVLDSLVSLAHERAARTQLLARGPLN